MAEITVRVTPKSSNIKILVEDDIVRIWVNAPPSNGEANQAMIKTLAKKLGIGTRNLEIVSGLGSRVKKVRVDGMSTDDVMARLS